MGRDHQIGDMGCAAVPACLAPGIKNVSLETSFDCYYILAWGDSVWKAPLTGLLPLCAYKGGMDGCFCRLFCSHLTLLGFSLFCFAAKAIGLRFVGVPTISWVPYPFDIMLLQYTACRYSCAQGKYFSLRFPQMELHFGSYYPAGHPNPNHLHLNFGLSLRIFSCLPCS